jgi:hypothetical protein
LSIAKIGNRTPGRLPIGSESFSRVEIRDRIMKDREMFRLGFFSRSAIASALLFFILSVFATANVLT